MAITRNEFNKIWGSTSSVPEYTFSDADYQDGWEFVDNLPPTRAMWDTLQRRNDQKAKYLLDTIADQAVSVKNYGAKGDGVTDDTQAIQMAISENPTRSIFFPDGTYLVSETLKTSRNQFKYSQLKLSRYAVIKASSTFNGEYVLYIGGLDNNYDPAPVTRCDFIGGVIDGSGVANGIYTRGQTTMIYDTIIRGCKLIGICADAKTYCEEIYVEGQNCVAGSIGFIFNATDSVNRRLRTTGFETGIQVNASSNIFEGCHPFYGSTINDATYQSSVGFEINATRIFLTDCYADNFATGVHIKGEYSVFSVNFELYYLTRNKNINRYFVKQDSGKYVSSFVNSVCTFPNPASYPGANYGYSGSLAYSDNACFTNTSITGGASVLTLGYNDLMYRFEQRITFPGGTAYIYQSTDVLGMVASQENEIWTGSGILLGAKGGNLDGQVLISAEGTNGAKQLILKDDGTITFGSKALGYAQDYLPLSGGTMIGTIMFGTADALKRNTDTAYLRITGGTGYTTGASITLMGQDRNSQPGEFMIRAKGPSSYKDLNGKPDGTLLWDGNAILTAGGGTITGNSLYFSSQWPGIKSSYTNNAGVLSIYGGEGDNNGARIRVNGKNNSNAGIFTLQANNGTDSKELAGNPNGTLTWDGQPIQTSSDKRLKQGFSDVPASALEAWGKVEWKRFKYKSDADKKGAKNCRWHVGLVAQDVQKVGEDSNVDLLKYGILCHDVQEATEEREAVDLWTVRYEEALAMEAVYLRREIAKLHEEVKTLKEK